MTRGRKPPTPVSLDQFLRGLFAGLVLSGRTRFRTGTGVLDEALHWTLRDLDKMRRRNRVRFAFRVGRKSLANPTGALATTLHDLAQEGIVRLPDAHQDDLVITMDADRAKDVLRDVDTMIPMAGWAARCFLRRHATARVHPLRRARPPTGAQEGV